MGLTQDTDDKQRLADSIRRFAKAHGFPRPSGAEIINAPDVRVEGDILTISLSGKYEEPRRDPMPTRRFPDQAAALQHAVYYEVLGKVPVGVGIRIRNGEMVRRLQTDRFAGTASFTLDLNEYGGVEKLTQAFDLATDAKIDQSTSPLEKRVAAGVRAEQAAIREELKTHHRHSPAAAKEGTLPNGSFSERLLAAKHSQSTDKSR